MVTANSYADNPRVEWIGALIEETSAFRSDIELFYDLHTLVWGPALTDSIEWTTTADLLPERVDGDGTVSWNSNLQWSQAMYILLVESHRRDEPFGLAPAR